MFSDEVKGHLSVGVTGAKSPVFLYLCMIYSIVIELWIKNLTHLA